MQSRSTRCQPARWKKVASGQARTNASQRAAPPPGMAHFAWDGIGSDGTPAPPGTYFVQADAVVNGAATALETFAAAPVSSVSLGRAGEGLTLNLGGLGAYGFDAVREVFD